MSLNQIKTFQKTKNFFQSCSGCRLSRLPDVKQFIFEDLPN